MALALNITHIIKRSNIHECVCVFDRVLCPGGDVIDITGSALLICGFVNAIVRSFSETVENGRRRTYKTAEMRQEVISMPNNTINVIANPGVVIHIRPSSRAGKTIV
ncbi:hypothetical protein GQX74_007841 [Glossina fuscipes]|nr:hypothetical protein GQX74_007841 [Glossina fuscipes]